MRRSLVLVALAGLTAIATCACTGSGSGSRPEPTLGPILQITSVAQIKLPIAAYEWSPQDLKTIDAGQQVMTAKCVKKFGATYTAHPTSDESVLFDFSRRYGMVDAAEAARSGYLPPKQANSPSDSKTGPNAWNPSPREQEAVTGFTATGQPSKLKASDGSTVPDHGCATWAFQQLLGDGLKTVELPSQILSDSMSAMYADSRTHKADADWAACMKEYGFTFTRRADASNSVAGKSKVDEIAMAKRDVACAQKTNYVGTLYAVDLAYQKQIMAKMDGQLTAFRAARQAMVARCNQAIAGS